MTCEHLQALEKELIDAKIKVTARGQLWGQNCREWVYFDCVFTDLEKTMSRLILDKRCVKVHDHVGTHDGQEYGLVCECCYDAVMGLHPQVAKSINRTIKEWV